VHETWQVINIVGVVDALQIPAFLCRQTDLVYEVGNSNCIVNIKKGQFLAPEDVGHIIKKIESTGNRKIMITERGTCFGYHNLIVDYRSFMKMKKFGYPVIFDITHSQQEPSIGKETGGSTEYAIAMAKGAIATGYVDGLFFECHPDPKNALSDKATSLDFGQVEFLIHEIVNLWRYINLER
jgi:2-dehydro-3-deoxyphosphooctonate aldolase (KDO 8-P synthase)